MDFEKLKKAAKETLKIMSSKDEDQQPIDTAEESISETDTVAPQDDDTVSGDTQRIDLKSMLSRFKSKMDGEGIFGTDDPSDDDAELEPYLVSAPAESIDELTKTVDEIDKRTAEITVAADENQERTFSAITELSKNVSQLRDMAMKSEEKQGVSVNSLMDKLSATDKKLNEISNSLSGISKLNDSIFDLKNAQMNTKNSLGELESEFYKMKRKMSTSILIISIISAIIAILEIINLLS